MNNADAFWLNWPADRVYACIDKIFKSLFPATRTEITEKGWNPSTQCLQPVQLAGTAGAFDPSSAILFVNDAWLNSFYRSLKPGKVSFGAHSDNCTAYRASITTQPDAWFKTIEIGKDKTMPPYFMRIAFGANFRTLPFKFFLFFLKFSWDSQKRSLS